MCGRTTRLDPDIFPFFSFLGPLDLPPGILTASPNIHPTENQLVILNDDAGKPEARMMKWGFVPAWMNNPKGKAAPFNARSETAAEKPYFRDAFRSGRCLVIVDGFYEWKKLLSVPGSRKVMKQPYFIHMKSAAPFALAGLYAGDTCTILTAEPNALISEVYDRMPCILGEDDSRHWLDTRTALVTLQEMLRSYQGSDMELWPVADLNDPMRRAG